MSAYKPNLVKTLFHTTRRIIAKYWLKLMRPTLIGITGSQGKTTTSYLLSKLFPDALITDRNLDTIFNVPITALNARPWQKIAIFELGIDHVGEMAMHLEIVRPQIAIVTGISAVHSDNEHLGSVENTIKEKSKLVQALPTDGYAILNWDDENVRNMQNQTKAEILFFGTDKANCDIWFNKEELQLSSNGTTGILHDGLNQFTVQTKLLGKHQFYNIASAYLVYKIINLANKYNLSQIQKNFALSISKIESLKGRLSLEDGPLQTLILNDSLRANPSSTKAGLEILQDIEYQLGKKIAVLGEMGELGDLAESSHKDMGQLIAEVNPDIFIGIGPLQKFCISEAIKFGYAKERAFYADNPIAAALLLKPLLQANDLIYLKASLMRHMERLLMVLNNEQVNCDVISCPFYNQCSKCKYRHSGYQNLM